MKTIGEIFFKRKKYYLIEEKDCPSGVCDLCAFSNDCANEIFETDGRKRPHIKFCLKTLNQHTFFSDMPVDSK